VKVVLGAVELLMDFRVLFRNNTVIIAAGSSIQLAISTMLPDLCLELSP